MDLDTENKIAALLLKEAAELRRQAEKEGVHVYLRQPKARGRPNSRFLTATVLGVQQANKAVEVNEMWRVRQKELELNNKLEERSRHENNRLRNHGDIKNSGRTASKRHFVNDGDAGASCSTGKTVTGNQFSTEDGLKDEEIEEFLHSRVKRGRGAVGSRIDETGPYLPCPESEAKPCTGLDVREPRIVLGPEKSSSLKSYESSGEELDEDRRKKPKKNRSRSSDKKHSRKHRSEEKSRGKKRKKREKERSTH